MKKITAIILTKNEENMIADCIDSLQFCDEVIVIDDKSIDRTAEIAKHMGATVYEYEKELFSFAERRNIGKTKAKGKWLFYIDADERVTKQLQESIQKITDERNPSVRAYRVERRDFYFGKHEWPTTEHLERLFRKDVLLEWYGDLHETAKVDGEIGDLRGYLDHYTHRDLSSMLAKTIIWSQTEAQLRLNAHHPKMTWWRFPRVMWKGFYGSYVKQKGYKIGVVGLLESLFQAFSMFITYARLWELQLKKEDRAV